MGIGPNGYHTLRDILGYNAKYNFVLSDRGRGKTYTTRHFLMQQDGQFMQLYRQSSDMILGMQTWADPLIESGYCIPEDVDIDVSRNSGGMIYFKEEPKIFVNFLTQVNEIKQMKFPDTLNWVWMDEFIPMAYKKLRGIDSEGDAIRVICKTIDHDTAHPRESRGLKPLRVLMYANPFTWDNPILSYFKINGLLGPGIHRAGPGIVWELLEPYEETRTDKKQTVDDFLGNEVNRNMGFMKQSAFVGSFPKGLTPNMSVRAQNHYFLLLRGGTQRGSGNLYVKPTQKHVDNVAKWGTLAGLTGEENCIDGSYLPDFLRRMAYNGKTYFEDINTKFDWLNIITDL